MLNNLQYTQNVKYVHTFLTIFTVLCLPSIKHHIVVPWGFKELMIHVRGGCWEDLQESKHTKLHTKQLHFKYWYQYEMQNTTSNLITVSTNSKSS